MILCVYSVRTFLMRSKALIMIKGFLIEVLNLYVQLGVSTLFTDFEAQIKFPYLTLIL